MAKVLEGVVLSDKLFVEFEKFKSGAAFDKYLVSSMFKFFTSNAPATNISQYERTGIGLSIDLKKQLASNGLYRQSLEELAKDKTWYKIILCDDNSEYPYVNVVEPSEKFEMDLTISFRDQESRTKAILHLKELCSKARKVTIYDKFFCNDYFNDNVSLLSQIIPRHPLSLAIACENLTDSDISLLQRINSEWTVLRVPHSGFHDRYVWIDDSIEVVLSSGFDHLSRPRGELLYSVRRVQSQRL